MEEQKKSKFVVVGLIVLILIGVGIWIYLERSAAMLIDRGEGMRFGAKYEKDCQSRYEPDMCKRMAARHHGRCFKSSVKPGAEGGVEYDMDVYMKCLQEQEEEFMLQQM